MKTQLKIDNFHLKIIAMVTMFIDHFAAILLSPLSPLYVPMRIIGRMAFPLFAFVVYEGSVHSKKPWHYLARLILMFFIVGVGIYIIGAITPYPLTITRNIFVDLVTIALTIILLRQKGWLKLFALLPIGYIILAVYLQFPNPFYPDYELYGVTLGIGFYLINLATTYLNQQKLKALNIDIHDIEKTSDYRFYKNVYAIIYLITVNIIWYFLALSKLTLITMEIQSYAILAGVPLLFYSQNRGYNQKWFQYGSYLFYPVHLILLYVISLIVNIFI